MPAVTSAVGGDSISAADSERKRRRVEVRTGRSAPSCWVCARASRTRSVQLLNDIVAVPVSVAGPSDKIAALEPVSCLAAAGTRV